MKAGLLLDGKGVAQAIQCAILFFSPCRLLPSQASFTVGSYTGRWILDEATNVRAFRAAEEIWRYSAIEKCDSVYTDYMRYRDIAMWAEAKAKRQAKAIFGVFVGLTGSVNSNWSVSPLPENSHQKIHHPYEQRLSLSKLR
jgi:hypothetical protein